MSVLDAFPFPWADPVARELHAVLVGLRPTTRAALFVAERAGVDTTTVHREQSPSLLWYELLDAGAATGRLRALVEAVHADVPTSVATRFLADLLADRSVAVSAGPRPVDGAEGFLAADDTVGREESLLFGDDLSVEVGRLPALVTALEHLIRLAPAVCRVTARVAGTTRLGTAFRVGAALLLTSWHVVHDRETGVTAETITAEFEHVDDGAGGLRRSVPVPCDPAGVVGDPTDDWALLPTVAPLRPAWTPIPLVPHSPRIGQQAFVIGHPLGTRQRAGIVRNTVSYLDDRVMHYLTDTQLGSSGSPVLLGDGTLVAVHRHGGLPQELPGLSPLRKNEGVRVPRILAGLGERGLVLDG